MSDVYIPIMVFRSPIPKQHAFVYDHHICKIAKSKVFIFLFLPPKQAFEGPMFFSVSSKN